MTLENLEERKRSILKQAHAKISEIKDDTPARMAESLEGQFNRMMEEVDAIDAQIITLRSGDKPDPRRPNFNGRASGVDMGDDDSAHWRAFGSWLRAPHDDARKLELKQAEKRLASGLTGAAGGYSVPEMLVTPIMTRAADENPFRQICRVIQVTTTDVKLPLSQGNATSGWVGENDTRSPTTEPTLTLRTPTFGTGYANVTVTEELAEDSAIDIVDWFSDEVGRKMGEAEMASIIAGDGVDKPTGLLNIAPASGADGTRPDKALRYLPTGATNTLGANPADLLISTVYNLKASYRRNARWVMNSTIAATVRKLKNASGDYLWADSLRDGQPAFLLGYPVVIAESMANEGANTFPIMFGDFTRGYVICDRRGLTALVDPYATKGFVQVYLRYRVGGSVYDEDAIRAIKCATT